MDFKTMTYIRSATEFNRASMKGFWETLWHLLARQETRLLSLAQALPECISKQATYQGVRDIPLKEIVGSAGRGQDFTPHFYPCLNGRASRERWRTIYTLAMTGGGFPPIEVCKIGDRYFVEDGHHRVSVANYLKWQTIQAHVMELSLCEERNAPYPSQGCLASA